MPIRFVFTLVLAAAWSLLPEGPVASQTRRSTAAETRRATVAETTQARDSTLVVSDAITSRIAAIQATVRVRDSLAAMVDSARGASRDLLDELIAQRQSMIRTELLDVANQIRTEAGEGRDVNAARTVVNDMIRTSWPGFLAQLERWRRILDEQARSRDAATGAARLAIESEMTRESERVISAYEALVDLVRAFERAGVDVAEQRAYLVQSLPVTAEGLVTRVQLANRDRVNAGAMVTRDASNAELRFALEANEEKLRRATHSLATAIRLMDRMDLETQHLRVALISATGRITSDVFHWSVFVGLLKNQWTQLLDFLAGKAPQWIFQGLLIVLTFLGFRALSHLVQRIVGRAVRHSGFSELLRDTVVRLSGLGIMIVGFVVILTQLGVQVAPLLAGLGVAGFVVGFALQNTLSNFAAGGMILGNHPFDVGDEIEVAGVTGIVRRMSLVSTTILTPDNQTLIIPNSSVWDPLESTCRHASLSIL